MLSRLKLNSVLLGVAILCWSATASAATEIGEDQYVIFYHNDMLGSPTAVTDHNGNVLWHEHSEPFGRSRNRVSSSKNELYSDHSTSRKGYTGHLKDDGADLVYMKARYYDPVIGRFYSNDPVGFTPDNPNMFNSYAYANNNPYRYLDEDGRSAKDVQIILQDISEKFPEIKAPKKVVYGNLPEGTNAQTSLDWFGASIHLPEEAEYEVLNKDSFFDLYGTIFHESMHVTDSALRRMWDGFWGNDDDKMTQHHKEIYARENYEMYGTERTGPPVGPVWNPTDEEITEPRGIDTDELFDSTRTEVENEDN